MPKTFKIVGLLLLIAGAALIFSQISVLSKTTTPIGLPGNIKGFTGNHLAVSEQDIKTAFAHAELAMNQNVGSYKNWNKLALIASWIAFLLGGIITLLAGYLGYSKTENVTAEVLLASIKDKVKLSKVVGLIAATATLMTGFSVKAKEEAEIKRAKGIEIRDLIVSSYKDIQQAKEDEVKLILEKLRLQSQF